MRKIESQMIQAIKSETDWKSGNTKVINFYNDGKEVVVTSIFLHDNLIAEVTDTDMTIFDGGYQSVTTKSRLNALCDEFCITGEGVFQKNYQWYVRLFTGAINGKSVFTTKEFTNGYVFSWKHPYDSITFTFKERKIIRFIQGQENNDGNNNNKLNLIFPLLFHYENHPPSYHCCPVME